MKMKDVCGLDQSRTYRTMFLLCALLPLPTSADITCASCFAPIQIHGNEALEQIIPTVVVNRQFDTVTVGSAVKSGILRLDRPQLFPKAHVSRRDRVSPTEEKDGTFYSASSSEGIKVDRRVKRGVFPSEREKSVNSAAAPRSEFRRTGGVDGTARGPRQNEPHLVTSTFALSGDSAHNQAMVLWSGYNSSVILILTKLFDFNLGTVTESSLWRPSPRRSTSPDKFKRPTPPPSPNTHFGAQHPPPPPPPAQPMLQSGSSHSVTSKNPSSQP